MSEDTITAQHIQKLGHHIPEIRERALLNINSKLERGIFYDNDLARSKELFWLLFEWFKKYNINEITHDAIVLNILKRIIKSESGVFLIELHGIEEIINGFTELRNVVNEKCHSILDEILMYLSSVKSNGNINNVPPLNLDHLSSCRSDSVASGRIEHVGTTATTIEGFVDSFVSLEVAEGDQQVLSTTNKNAANSGRRTQCSPFRYYTFLWQWLIGPDRHVLESVEETLRNPAEPASLLNSCEFFTDILLHDFPAEVFLQRPAIIKQFHDLLWSSPSSRITTAILKCLSKLTKEFINRIHYYNDPNIHNLKLNNYHIDHLTPRDENNDNELLSTDDNNYENISETLQLMKKQMNVPQYCLNTINSVFDYLYINPEVGSTFRRKKCLIGVNAALILLKDAISLLKLSVKSTIWGKEVLHFDNVDVLMKKFDETLRKYGEVLQHFRIKVLSEDFNEETRMIQLHLLTNFVTFYLDFIPSTKLPTNLKSALSNTLLDPSLSRLFPTLHEHIHQLIKSFDQVDDTYEICTHICRSMSASIQFLREYKSLPFTKNILLIKNALASLEFHRNMKIITGFIDLCANKLTMHSFDEEIFEQIDDILLKLLSHKEQAIRLECYKACQQKIVKTIGAKLNVSKSSAPGSQILFLLRAKVLMTIATYGLHDTNEDIKQLSEDILVHILKCKILVSEDIWREAVASLLPAFPVLLTQVEQKSLIGRNILSILDPDRSRLVNFPLIDVLRLNVGLLFSKSPDARIEAVSRLCWLLSVNANENNGDSPRRKVLLPHLNNLHDKALSLICQLEKVLDFKSFRSAQTHFYQPSSLQQVLDLLSAKNVEPVIRRSAITQISVMMEDPILHSTFLELNGLRLIGETMLSALTENDYANYPDSVVPCLSILKNLCLYHASTRLEIAQSEDFLFWILRALFMFCPENRVKQDGAVLLFLVAFGFNNCILGSPLKNDLSVLEVLRTGINCPFDCKSHGTTSEYSLGNFKELRENKWAFASLQIHWNIEWFKGLDKLLQENLGYNNFEDDFCDSLKLSANDLRAIKSSSIEFSLKKHLNAIYESHKYEEILENLHKLTICLNLYDIVKSTFQNAVKSVETYDWEKAFSRYLKAPPAGQQDNIMLTNILDFLTLLLPHLKSSKSSKTWITCLIMNKNHYFNELLACELTTDQEPDVEKMLNSLLAFVNVCTISDQSLFGPTKPNDNSNGYSHVVKTIVDNLQSNNGQHFYNLAYLDRLLNTLVHVTASLGWSDSKQLKKLCDCAFELLNAFHCGKGPTAADSLMGLSITRNVVFVLNHFVAEMQHFNVKQWEEYFLLNDAIDASCFMSVFALRFSRDVVLRAAAINLLAGFAMSPICALEMIQAVSKESHKNHISLWKIALSIVCDHEESNIVREHAALLLTNLTSHTISTSLSSENDNSLLCGLLIKKPTTTESQTKILIALLDTCNFFAESETLLKRLHTTKTFNFQEHRNQVLSSHNENTDDFIFVYNKTFEVSNASDSLHTARKTQRFENVFSITTPGLVKSLAMFIYNLINLMPQYMCAHLQELGLIKLFFKCIVLPDVEIEHPRDLMFYADILEMNAAVCALLARCATTNEHCLLTIGNTRDCLEVVTSLLDPGIYVVSLPHLLYLRNKLWSNIYNLVDVLLSGEISVDMSSNISKYDANSLILQLESRKDAFLLSLCESISTDLSNDLQLSALNSLTSLLKCTTNHLETIRHFQAATQNKNLNVNNDAETDEQSNSLSVTYPSIQNLLDNTKTPRSAESIRLNLNNNNNFIPNKFSLLEEIYFGSLSTSNTNRTTSASSLSSTSLSESREDRKAGAELCKRLLEQYEVLHLQQPTKVSKTQTKNKKKQIVLNTLSSLLSVSNEAKSFALENGLLPKVIEQLKHVHIQLSFESVDCLRRVADKRRLTPLLVELEGFLGLLTNFLFRNEDVKSSAANLGLSDIIHKLWTWLLVQKSLLSVGLRLLCTLTTNCSLAAASLALTTGVAGAGPRKTPSNSSLLHVLSGVIVKEMELVSRTHNLDTLQLCFDILHNAITISECRFILVKNNFLAAFGKLHPALTKRQKQWEQVELTWLEFLGGFSVYPEGQTIVGKMQEVFDIVLALCSSPNKENRLEALTTLRNLAFHHSNRARLLGSDCFLGILSARLSGAVADEVNLVVATMWTLAANCQKAKMVFKSAGLDHKIKDYLRILYLNNYSDVNEEELERIQYVFSLISQNS